MELLTKGLDGNMQDSSANRIWNVTAGNPLYLREVVLSSASQAPCATSTANGDGGVPGPPEDVSRRSSRPGWARSAPTN